ncbi:ABC transporter [Halorubrum persicum]|uniref:ABC transporter n=1 Tax=Halorubrum persicum TaxID=1383844 RepID=A0A2G1WMD5_9EURY|nr:ABC transporter ATP-binding protein [Halorubrum persicum]PHQ40136.1 ABC transporter [Halorubrum persicum]
MAGDTPHSVVQVSNLQKKYGSTTAVDDVSFEIHTDEIFGLLGPNGAGKTTLVELLQGLRTPTAGAATVLGYDIQDDLYAVKDRIGVVPQSFHTFERLSVRENIALMRDLYSDPLAVETVLDRLDLDDYADTAFGSLSGGFQRRTGIAMALVSDPDVLFLDEPTTGLDPAARRGTWQQIDQLPALGTTVVLTTHYMDEIEALADRVALMVDGGIRAIDTVAALVERYAGTVKINVTLPKSTADGDDQIMTTLRQRARETHQPDSQEMVGIFDDQQTAQKTFSDLHGIDPNYSIELVSAGMEDVFLEVAGSTLDTAGNRR